MAKTDSIGQWLNDNREMAIEALRIYLGISLILKGIYFIANHQPAVEYMDMIKLPFFGFLSVHAIVVVHLVFGFFLAIGLLTRIAALLQVPLLLGAIFFVHMQQGLFTKAQTLEYVILLLVLLLVFVVYGGGRLSVDYFILKYRGRLP